mgnify:CR=1 FL=1
MTQIFLSEQILYSESYTNNRNFIFDHLGPRILLLKIASLYTLVEAKRIMRDRKRESVRLQRLGSLVPIDGSNSSGPIDPEPLRRKHASTSVNSKNDPSQSSENAED